MGTQRRAVRAVRVGIAAALAATVLSAAPGALAARNRPPKVIVFKPAKKVARHPADAVVAVIDTGINPYHKVFRDRSPRARKHPSTYLPGYPKKATPLRLSLQKKNYWAAVRKDCERVWSKVKPGKLYWFPGTKIVGAITFLEPGSINCAAPKPEGAVLLDEDGHGTMTASRAASTDYGACRQCRVVSVQFPTSINILSPSGSTAPAVAAIEWAANNSKWIDAQSNSWGPFLPVWEPTGQAGLLTANPTLVKAVEDVSSKHLAFWASGNGALFRFGAVGHPTTLSPHFAPSAITVGGHDSGFVNTWPGFPAHVVSDSCDSWAAFHRKVGKSADTVGGGTSAATPFAAGGAAKILLEARRILDSRGTGVENGLVARGRKGIVEKGPIADGKLTMEEWKEVTFKTATRRPKGQFEDGPPCEPGLYGPTPVRWTDVPDGYPEYLHIGYGAVDDAAAALAKKVLKGKMQLPDRPETDEFFARERQIREATHPVFRAPAEVCRNYSGYRSYLCNPLTTSAARQWLRRYGRR